MKNFGKDMTEGSIPKHLLTFSVPMLIGNVLQTAYSIIDTIWLGNTVGSDAVGATAVSFPIIFILISLVSGATIATTILVSQYYGAKDFERVERVVNNSFALALILGAALTAIGLFSSSFLLKLMDTPPEIFSMATGYLNITFAGFIFMYLSFLITSILRGIGDTKTPLIFQAVGVFINAILDPFMIIGIGPFPRMGLEGAALASVIAQIIALVISLIYLNKKSHLVAFNPRKFILDRSITFQIFKLGFPSIIQQSLVSVGNAFITTFVNAFGSSAISAFGAAGKIDQIAFMPAMSLGMAASALTGQNLGAEKPERVKHIFKWGVVMTSAITILISIFAISFPRQLLSMFLKELHVIDIGVQYLRVVGGTYILFAIMFVSNGIINGAGHTLTTMMFTLISLWGIRVPLSAVLSGWAYDRTANNSSYLISLFRDKILSVANFGLMGIWISIVVSFGVTMTISILYYRSGRWKKPVIRKNFKP